MTPVNYSSGTNNGGRSLWNQRHDALTCYQNSGTLRLHVSVPSGDAGCHACSGDAPVPYAQGNRGSC